MRVDAARTRNVAAAASTVAAAVALVCAMFISPDAECRENLDLTRLAFAPAAAPCEPELVAPGAARTEGPTRASALTTHAPDPRADARRIARGLATEIRSVGFDREAWITQARAIAATLEPGTIDALAEIAAARVASDELIATAELLRHCRAPGARSALPEAALKALRTAVGSPETAAASAAARALAALGTDADRFGYLEALAHGAIPHERELAAWALQAADSERVTYLLAELVRAPSDERAGDLALSTLGALLSGHGPLSPGARESARAALTSAIADPRARTQHRALVAMAALDDAAASEPLFAAMTDPTRSPEHARTAANALASMNDPGVAMELARLVSDPRLDAARRGLVAGALLASPTARDATPYGRREALGVLAAIARDDPDPAARRRAVWKLTGTRETAAGEALARVADADPDPGVRAAATRALLRFARSSQGRIRPVQGENARYSGS